jgi:hypothetical protein
MLRYNNSNNVIEYWNGTAWVKVIEGWGTAGNTATNPAVNFIGTADNVALSVRTNNTQRLNIAGGGEAFFSSRLGVNTTVAPATNTHLRVNGNFSLGNNIAPSNTNFDITALMGGVYRTGAAPSSPSSFERIFFEANQVLAGNNIRAFIRLRNGVPNILPIQWVGEATVTVNFPSSNPSTIGVGGRYNWGSTSYSIPAGLILTNATLIQDATIGVNATTPLVELTFYNARSTTITGLLTLTNLTSSGDHYPCNVMIVGTGL